MASPFIGEIKMFGGNFAPRNWALCQGQLLPIAQNTALFSILGTIYGGDGRTTFALPDLRGRVPISSGTGPGLPTYREGQRGGQSQHVLTTQEMPSHNHAGNIRVGAEGKGSGATNIAAGSFLGDAQDAMYRTTDGGNSNNVVNGTQIANTGGSQAHNNMQPYLAVNYIICTNGLFPSRN